MKCPVCEERGLRSKVIPKGSQTTLMAYSPSYDEDGVLHIHNNNRRGDGYACSNGHMWSVIYKKPCPAEGCDFPGEEPVVKIHRDGGV